MASKIKTQLKNTNSLSELEHMAKKAHQHITCCGRRYLKFQGYEGTTSLYKIHEKLNDILDKTPFTYPERKAINKRIFKIKAIMKDLYIDNFERKTNLITRILAAIRDFFERFSGAAYSAKFLMKEINLNIDIQEDEIRWVLHKRKCEKEGEASEGTSIDASTISTLDPEKTS
jgi:hypothetical protein